MNKEIWKDIPEFEGLYQVSNLGRVKSLERTIITSNGKNCCRKMTKEDVINVRSIKDKTIKELAKMYDISITSMSNIINYKSYKNIK